MPLTFLCCPLRDHVFPLPSPTPRGWSGCFIWYTGHPLFSTPPKVSRADVSAALPGEHGALHEDGRKTGGRHKDVVHKIKLSSINCAQISSKSPYMLKPHARAHPYVEDPWVMQLVGCTEQPTLCWLVSGCCKQAGSKIPLSSTEWWIRACCCRGCVVPGDSKCFSVCVSQLSVNFCWVSITVSETLCQIEASSNK